MFKKLFCLIFLFFFLLSTTLFAGAMKEKEKEVSQLTSDKVDTLRLEGGDWGLPTPYAHYPRGPGGFKMCLIFDSLLERDEEGLIPWLASDYEIQDGGKNYLFTLQDGVTWHDGKQLTADDVKFTFEYAGRHPMAWSYIRPDDIEKVKTLDKRKVLITVRTPGAPMLYNLGRTRIIPKHVWEKVDNPKEFIAPESCIGCGPYRLTDYSKEHGTYRFEAYEHYWGPRQRVQTIEFVPVSDPILTFEKEETDLTYASPDVLHRFEKEKQFKIVKSPGFWGYRLLFNMKDYPVFQIKEVRQAIIYAIDKQELIEKIARGAAVPGSGGILPPDHVMYNHNISRFSLDLERTVQLLEKAGFDGLQESGIRKNGEGEKLTFVLLVGGGKEVRLAEVLKEQLGKVGIGLKVLSVDRKTRDTRVRSNEYQMALIGHGGWGSDPDYLRERFGGKPKGGISPSASRLHGYVNEQLNRLLEEQVVAFDEEKRRELVYQIQDILAEEVLEIPLFYTTRYSVYRPRKHDGWMFMFDHHSLSHSKLSYLERD